jgi:hypothetical protein
MIQDIENDDNRLPYLIPYWVLGIGWALLQLVLSSVVARGSSLGHCPAVRSNGCNITTFSETRRAHNTHKSPHNAKARQWGNS